MDTQSTPPSREEEGEQGGSALSPLGKIAILAGPLVAVVLLLLPAPANMPPEAWRMVAVVAWMVIWWLSEAVPIPATALLPLVLMPLFGIGDLKPVAQAYADPIIFLFLGGFLIALAMQKTGLHRRIALTIVRSIGTSPDRIILGFMLATGFLSMWISNTATAVMMYAVGLSVVDFIERQTRDAAAVRNFGVALMLAIAYSASIGGVGTLIGTPPNALLASFLSKTYGIEITFFRWMLIGVPVVVVMLPATWLILTRVLFPARAIAVASPASVIEAELRSLGRASPAERLVGVVFAYAALAWILRQPLVGLTGLPLDDTMIALAAALVLFAVPTFGTRGGFALDWEITRDLPWGVLLLFGGGLALAGGFTSTGLAEWIGGIVGGVRIGTLALVLLVTTAIVYLTEITSNTASTATFLPIMGAVAVGLKLDPMLLTIPIAIGASMAFMMPVATPPNAIVFSYERMQLRDMVRAGFLLNIIAVVVAFGAIVIIGPLAFGLEF